MTSHRSGIWWIKKYLGNFDWSTTGASDGVNKKLCIFLCVHILFQLHSSTILWGYLITEQLQSLNMIIINLNAPDFDKSFLMLLVFWCCCWHTEVKLFTRFVFYLHKNWRDAGVRLHACIPRVTSTSHLYNGSTFIAPGRDWQVEMTLLKMFSCCPSFSKVIMQIPPTSCFLHSSAASLIHLLQHPHTQFHPPSRFILLSPPPHCVTGISNWHNWARSDDKETYNNQWRWNKKQLLVITSCPRPAFHRPNSAPFRSLPPSLPQHTPV